MSEIRERPILMSAPMAIATLADLKSQTRRIAKFPSWVDRIERVGDWYTGEGTHPAGECDHPKCAHIVGIAGGGGPSMFTLRCPYGKPGDKLWVRETWKMNTPPSGAIYRADSTISRLSEGKWKPSIFMPRWASRITLEVTEVRVQRLQDISEEDCIAEGISSVESNAASWVPYLYCDYNLANKDHVAEWWASPIDSYRTLWESINGPGSWDVNPWVWAISFRRV